MTAIHHMAATALAAAYRKGALSPVEAVRAALDRITAWDGKINAMYTLDAAAALDQAAEALARWRAGVPKSEIDGIAVTVKDNIAVRGMAMPIGTAAGDMTPSMTDAPPVARLREAGSIILGKTTMPDYGMLVSGVSSLHGVTRNPWNLARNAGGSSSGAAAGLVAGYAPLALGTDIGGSVRLPAAYNGVFALKPSLGRVPMYPPFLGRVAGPMTRTVTDAVALMTVLTRPDPRDFMALPHQDIDWPRALDTDLTGTRIGLVHDIGAGLKVQPQVREAIGATARAFAAAGVEVTPLKPFLTPEMFAGLDGFFQARLLADYQALPPERQARVLPFVAAWCRRAERLSAVDAAKNLALIILMREKCVAATEAHDFLLMPTSPITAYAAEDPAPGNDPRHPFEHIAFTAPFNQSEQPAASICCGFDGDGMPIGLQIVGRRFDDLGVLRMARAYEMLRPPLPAWPEP
jgi:aspartyl-tRNA(Asn)/glutamyl-tRNA(Gln) amidotransferase subunit A